MPQASAASKAGQNGRRTPVANGAPKAPARSEPSTKAKEKNARGQKPPDTQGLKDYQLGDCLGKGAFGSVYRALNWGTGETVAVKQVKLANLPHNELRTIMLEIDLLKNLHHPNIVKYHGFVKSSESLYIILEYCENGSLHSICKNFGKFPENLVALYMSQVLHGLLYLHEQGVIHRDIKGANILTTKEGTVKLADFGVATKATPGLHESGVVGTPYWMAPEVIELSGATTASDIWSLGCTVIELLDGKPPFHQLQPMPALFRIVNDDHPPFPESVSPTVQDFLMQCFQKDPNLRVSARKLLKHPWIMNARRTDMVKPVKPTKYDEAVKSVQQWNEALRSPEGSAAGTLRARTHTPTIAPLPSESSATVNRHRSDSQSENADLVVSRRMPNADSYRSSEQDQEEADVWDDDFASSINSQKLLMRHVQPIDNFDGKLSAEKLKAYATSGRPESTAQGSVAASRRPKTPPDGHLRDEQLQTVRATSPTKSKVSRNQRTSVGSSDEGSRIRSPKKVTQTISSQPRTQILRPVTKPSGHSEPEKRPVRPHPPKRSSSLYREETNEDYSDLIGEDSEEDALQQKLNSLRIKQESKDAVTPAFAHMEDLKSSPRSISTAKSGRTHSSDQSVSLRRVRSSMEIMKYADKVEEAEDFSDIADAIGNVTKINEVGSPEKGVANINMLLSKISNTAWLGDDEDQDDPFAQVEANLDEMDMKSKVAKDKHVRTCALVESLIDSLKINQPIDVLADISEQLMDVLLQHPDMRSVVISAHGLLPILEVLECCPHRDMILSLLKVINIIILDSVEIQENFCFVGGIPIVTAFADKKHPSEIRLEAAAFVRQMYQTSTLTLQMFISCGGLNVLVEFVEEDYDAERDLVLIGVNGIWSVFALQGSTPKNDFCRILSRSLILYPLSLILDRVLSERGELAALVEGRIVTIFLLFSQAENHVKESVADRMILKRVLKDLSRMSQPHRITMLKFIKNLSMLATTLDDLHGSNAIETLVELLNAFKDKPEFEDISNHVINIMFNLCRLSKRRQEDAALNGLVPILQGLIRTQRPVKEFALPILCDIAHSGRLGRKMLWQNKALPFYVTLLAEPYWQVTALDAIFVWLQEETARVEETLLQSNFNAAIVQCFTNRSSSVGDNFENLLEPLQKLLRLSPPLAASLAHPALFRQTIDKLNNKKAVVRGNLLRIIRSICDASEEQSHLLHRYDLYEAIQALFETDPAILVRNMASDLLATSENYDSVRSGFDVVTAANAHGHGRYRSVRRTSASAQTPPALYSSSSQPATPQHNRVSAAAAAAQGNDDYFDMSLPFGPNRARGSNVGTGGLAYRPSSRDSSSTKLFSSANTTAGASADYGSPAALGEPPAVKARLGRPLPAGPGSRPDSARPVRISLSPKKEDSSTSASRVREREGGRDTASPGLPPPLPPPSASSYLPRPQSSGNGLYSRRRRQTSGG